MKAYEILIVEDEEMIREGDYLTDCYEPLKQQMVRKLRENFLPMKLL